MPGPKPEAHEGAAALFVGRYRLGPVLGRGGAASVYQALDERLMRQVAIKVFRHDADPDLVRRFEAEARLLARLRHPGLVKIFDFGHTAQGPYLVLELLPGPPLNDLLCSGPRPLAETLRTGIDLAQTLAYVHSQGVVHRDVKPANILLDQDGCPRLADFGIARAVDTAGSTRTGTVMGTAAYLAPEQVKGQGAGPETDVYALGLVLIECLTAEREYPGPPAESAIARLRRRPHIPAGLPWPLTRALDQMTCADPEERISAAQCATLLTAALEHIGPPPAAPAPVRALTEEPTINRAAATQGANPLDRSRRWRRPGAAAVVAGTGLVWSLVAAGHTASPRQSSTNHAATSPSVTPHAPTMSLGSEPRPSAAAVAHTSGLVTSATTPGPSTTEPISQAPSASGNGAGDTKAAKAKGPGHGHGHGK
jgi:serine/threonine protein kinase